MSRWPRRSLEEVGVTLLDCVHKTPPDAGEGYPYVAIPQLKEGNIDFDEARRITEEDFHAWTQKALPQANDIVLSRRCNPGVTAHVPDGVQFALGQNLVLMRADGTQVFPPFLRWLLSGPEWWQQVGKYINVGAVFDSLRCAEIPKFELRIPTLPEQRAIASILGALDDKIELNRRMNATLESLARASFKSWFVDFDPVRINAGQMPADSISQEVLNLFPSSFQDSDIPEGWQEQTLGDVVEIFDSKRVPLSKKQRQERQGTYPYYGAASVMDYVDDFLFEGVYILMGEDGSVVNDDGTPVLQYVWGQFWVNNHAHVLKGTNGISDEHLLLHLQNSIVKPFVTGAVQPKINQGNLKRIPFLVPTPEIADAFSETLAPMFSQIRANSEESETLSKKRDALLPLLLSGDLAVDNFVERP